MKLKSKLISITASPRLQEMVQDIKDRRGYSTTTQVFTQGVVELYTRLYPAYMAEKKSALTPKARAREAVEEKEEKKLIAQEKLVDFCTELGGNVKTDGGGVKVCYYYNYANDKRYEQETPLEMLSEDLLKTQYEPSKTKVVQLQKDGKVDYKL